MRCGSKSCPYPVALAEMERIREEWHDLLNADAVGQPLDEGRTRRKASIRARDAAGDNCLTRPAVDWYAEALRLSALLDAPEAGGVLASVEGIVHRIATSSDARPGSVSVLGMTREHAKVILTPGSGASVGQRVTIEVRAVATGEHK